MFCMEVLAPTLFLLMLKIDISMLHKVLGNQTSAKP